MDITHILKSKGVSKAELAKRMNTHNQNINKMLNNPTESTIRKIAEALEIAPCQLFSQPSDTDTNTADCTELLGVVRVGDKTYTANNLEELRAIVAELEKGRGV